MIWHPGKTAAGVTRTAMRPLVVLALLAGLVAPLVSPRTASAAIARGGISTSYIADTATRVTLDSPSVTTADVAAGAILVAHLVATAEDSVSNVWICPLQAGWTQAARIADDGEVVQQIWWRQLSAPQDAFVSYTFESRGDSGCNPANAVATSMSGASTVYSGVDINVPVDAAVSVVNTGAFSVNAPSTTTSHPAGSRIVRYVASNLSRDIGPAGASLLYSLPSNGGDNRTIAAFDTVLTADGPAGEFTASSSRSRRWVATTVVLRAPSEPTEPSDTTAPVTTVSSAPYVAGAWSNVPVTIALSATDAGGSGVKEIVYSATGAQEFAETTAAGASTTVSIAAEGVTTVSFFARDIVGNVEAARTFVVKIDATAPVLAGAATTPPNANGWYNGDVTIAWTCGDARSGIAGACPPAAVVSGEGAGLSASATVADNAGNLTTTGVSTIAIDRTPPVTEMTLVPEWSVSAVTVTFTSTDNLSGAAATTFIVNGGPEQAGNQVTLSRSGVQTLRYWSIDRAGNVELPRTAEIKIDTIAPEITHRLSPEPNAAGWNSTPVTVTFACADGLSGIASCPGEQALATDGANQVASGVAVDLAGNTAADSVIVNVDQTAPEIGASRTPAANADGWNNTSVTVTFACADATSGVLDCTPPRTVGEGAGQSVTGTAIDRAGNVASVTVDGIDVDVTAPVITPSLETADGSPYVPGTWVDRPVTVTFACDDELSGVASCPAPRTFGEGAGQGMTGTATDLAGNTVVATVGQINIDLTGPSIVASATTADGQPYTSGTWTKQPVTVAFDCDDAGSGLAVACPAPVVVSASTSLAGQSVSGQVSDLAGRVATSDAILVMVDTDAPVFTFAPDDLSVDATSADGALIEWRAPVASDGVAGAVVPVCDAVSGSVFPPGATTVACAATDLAGNVASVRFVVTVNVVPPAVTVPVSMVVPADGPNGAVVHYAVTDGDDRGLATVTICAPPSGSRFPIGTTLVECSASNGVASATASFTVTVLGAADLLTMLRADTDQLVTNRLAERTLLMSLDLARASLATGNTWRSYAALLQYRVLTAWYTRLGRIMPDASARLQSQAQQVIDALW